jgi:hypothetical protein
VEQVTTENTRLHQQLCESVESQLLKEGHEEGGRDGLKRSTFALQNQLSEISKVAYCSRDCVHSSSIIWTTLPMALLVTLVPFGADFAHGSYRREMSAEGN